MHTAQFFRVHRIKRLPSRRGQSGVTLIMALIVLLVLTLLGISASGTSAVQAVMARNVQDTQRAFETAESGLNKAMNTAGSLDLYQEVPNSFNFVTGSNTTHADVATKFVAFSAPARGSGYSAINFDSANFDQRSTGSADTATTTLHQGVSQIVNKSE